MTFGFVEILSFDHLIEDRIHGFTRVGSELFISERLRVFFRAGQEHGEESALSSRELRGIFVKIKLRGRTDPENALAPFCDIQVNLQNPSLAEFFLRLNRQDEFFDFTPEFFVLIQKHVFDHLLCNGASSASKVPGLQIFLKRELDLAGVVPRVAEKRPVLADNDGGNSLGCYGANAHPSCGFDFVHDNIEGLLRAKVLHDRELSSENSGIRKFRGEKRISQPEQRKRRDHAKETRHQES